VVSDAAQAHGATYRGRPVGAFGDAAAFSLNAAKNLPTCGEGGMVTTDSAEVAERIRRMRQFGEGIDAEERSYVSTTVGWNHKINPVQAAFTNATLDRFDADEAARQANVRRLLDRLGELPGLLVPVEPADRRHVWHILRFRLDVAAMGLDGAEPARVRSALHRALRAEGVPISRHQIMPLPEQPVFTGRGIGGPGPWPVTAEVVADSLCLQRRHLNPAAGPTLEHYADAFAKVWDNRDVIAAMAAAPKVPA
jgi:dTDP-4-amino-4,6-dideoxygalactose transaminase